MLILLREHASRLRYARTLTTERNRAPLVTPDARRPPRSSTVVVRTSSSTQMWLVQMKHEVLGARLGSPRVALLKRQTRSP